jgi:hypothetical protein
MSAKDDKGLPTLQITHSPVTLGATSSHSSHNDCAKAWAIVGKILEGLLDVFSLGLGSLIGADDLLDSTFDLTTPGLGDVNDLFNNLGSTVTPVVILPAGHEFFFKDPAIDVAGNLSAQLTYKSEN